MRQWGDAARRRKQRQGKLTKSGDATSALDFFLSIIQRVSLLIG